MSEYWLISAPGDKTCQQTFDTMNNLTSKQHNLCNNYKFQIPDLKVGTLDQLVGLSDDLGKLDTYVEQITRKVAAYLGEVLEDQRDKLHENLLANNCPDPPADNASKLSYATKTSKNFLNNDDSTTPNTYGSAKLNAEGQCTHSSNKMKCLNHPCCYISPNNCKCDRSHEHFTTRTSSIVKFDEQCDSGADYDLEASVDEHFASFSSSAKLLNRIVDSNKVHRINQNSTNTTTTTLCSLGSISGSCNSAQFSEMNKIFNQQIHQKSPHTIKKQKTQQQQQQQHTYNNEHETKFSKVCRNSLGQKEIERTIEWWLRKEKKYTKKRRSTPVSSCCGGNGRSSPNNDINVAPGLPTSPHPADLSAYITRFQWDMAKYPIKQSLRNIADIISKQVGQIDGDLKTKATAYNNLKGNLQNLEKKQTGSLLTRNLADLVKKEHFILDSEYLTTLLVIVPKMMANDWLTNYEKITDMIVPRSSTLINQDNDYCLFNVTLFKKVVDEFKLHAREKKFIVRDFEYNEEELAAGKNEITKLITDKKKQFGPLVRWLKVNFSEAFCALIHVKALRVFVESVLRYGLPVNFQAILIEPYKKNVKRLREVLNQLYDHLDGSSAGAQASGLDNVEIPGLGFGQADYFPYVFYKINIDMIDTKA